MDKSQVRSCISGSGSITYDPLTGIIGGGGGGGGGASISYYLNGSVNQGTFSGNTYYEMNRVPVIGVGTNFSIAANGYIAQFITDANDPSQLNIPAGNWNFKMYFSASSGGGTPTFYVELYKWDGAAFTLIASSSTNPEGITNGTTVDLYTTALAVPATTLAITDRLAVRVYVNNSGRTITLHTEDNNLCQVITTFTTNTVQNTRLNANDTVSFYDYCGQAPLGTATSSAVWLIRRIEWATTTPVTKSAVGAWDNRASLTYV